MLEYNVAVFNGLRKSSLSDIKWLQIKKINTNANNIDTVSEVFHSWGLWAYPPQPTGLGDMAPAPTHEIHQ